VSKWKETGLPAMCRGGKNVKKTTQQVLSWVCGSGKGKVVMFGTKTKRGVQKKSPWGKQEKKKNECQRRHFQKKKKSTRQVLWTTRGLRKRRKSNDRVEIRGKPPPASLEPIENFEFERGVKAI